MPFSSINVAAVPPTCASPLLREWDRIDFSDAYALEVDADRELDLRECIVAVFDSLPRWVRAALIARDKLVGIFGLKTGKPPEQELRDYRSEVGQKIAVFETWESRPDTVVMGCRDKHLDFLCCFRLNRLPEGRFEFAMETFVKLHGLSGRAYFFFARIGHPFVVRAMLRSVGRRLAKGA